MLIIYRVNNNNVILALPLLLKVKFEYYILQEYTDHI